MNIPFIDLKTQYKELKSIISARINDVLEHGQYIMGPEVGELESKLARYTGSKHCITVASGTEALLISLMAIGVRPGDEIITTPFTFVATAEVIVLLGATPIFVDVEEDTGNIDWKLIEEKITSKTKAIIPVSLYGQPADMDEINAIAEKYTNITVIEDAAQSFGAIYKGRKSCNLSSIGCTSFFPSKPLGCYGDGGAIFTSDDVIAKSCREIRVHGQSQRYVHTRVGVGGRMDTLQCAIVLAKLERFEWEIARRSAVAQRYDELLQERVVKNDRDRVNGEYTSPSAGNFIGSINVRENRTSVYAQYTIRCMQREKVQEVCSGAGIPTAVHYPVPLNEQPAYSHLCCSGCTPVASKLSKQVISLPMGPDLLSDQQERIVDQLRVVERA